MPRLVTQGLPPALPAAGLGGHSTSEGGGGFALVWQAAQAQSFTAVPGNFYPVDCTSNAVTVTLPSNPALGATFGFLKYGVNTFTINLNGNNYKGASANLVTTGEGSEIMTWTGNTSRGYVDIAP